MRVIAYLQNLGIICVSHQYLRDTRRRFNLKDYVQIHHVIPRFCASHPILETIPFDVEGAGNFVLMPTYTGVNALSLRSDRLIHDGGHMRYCHYVWDCLDRVNSEEDLCLLLFKLHIAMRRIDPDVPWR